MKYVTRFPAQRFRNKITNQIQIAYESHKIKCYWIKYRALMCGAFRVGGVDTFNCGGSRDARRGRGAAGVTSRNQDVGNRWWLWWGHRCGVLLQFPFLLVLWKMKTTWAQLDHRGLSQTAFDSKRQSLSFISHLSHFQLYTPARKVENLLKFTDPFRLFRSLSISSF